MRWDLGLFLAGLFLFAPVVSWGQQASPPPATADCSPLQDAVLTATQTLESDRRQLLAANDPDGAFADITAGTFPSDVRQNLMILQEREEALSRCSEANRTLGDALISAPGCSGEQILNFEMSHGGEPEREIPIRRLPGTPAFFYESGMTIDADGAPNAYHPDNSGLDDLSNAGAPGNWEGLAKDQDGEPFVQGPDDPFPGFYVSATALADRSRAVSDPLRYVDASKIPYIVLPGGMGRDLGARPGDFSVVLNQRNARSSYAIFGDVGPSDRIGEGSVALAENLGIRSDARNGGARRGILYLVFPGSGNGSPRTIEEINAEGKKLFQAWGGSIQLAACKVQVPARPFEGARSAN